MSQQIDVSDFGTSSRRVHSGLLLPARTAPWIAASLVLLVVLALILRFPIERMRGLASVSYNEGWNAYREAQAAAGQPLYAAPPGLSVTNYPPVWFHVIGAAQHLGLDVNHAGRLVSLASVLLLGLMAGEISRCLRLSWPAAAFAALFFVAALILYSSDRIGMNDPQLFGMVFAAAGLLAYLRAPGKASWLLLSAACFTVGVFTKNNLIAFPLAVLLHLLLRRQNKGMAVWCLTGIVLAVLLFAVTLWWDGRFFLRHLLQPRAMVPGMALSTLVTYCAKFAAPLVLAILWVRRQKLQSPGGLIALTFGLTHLVAFGFASGDGVARNIFFEALFITSIAASAAVQDRGATGLVLCGWLVLAVSPVLIYTTGTLRHDAHLSGLLPKRQADFRTMTSRIAAEHGPVLCEDLLLCFEAHKPSGFDAYYVHDQILAGRIDEADILSMIQRREFHIIGIGSAEKSLPVTPLERWRFTAAFMRTLIDAYRPVFTGSGYTLLVPR